MSRTPHIGVVRAKYWAFMAHAMVECLDQIIKGQKTKIPLGVFYDAEKFFKIVLGQTTNTLFNNPLARINAHIIAWEVLNDCPTLQSHTLKETDGHFRRFAKFLENLKNQPSVPFGNGWAKEPDVPLNEEDQKTAIDLCDFFAALVEKSAGEGRY